MESDGSDSDGFKVTMGMDDEIVNYRFNSCHNVNSTSDEISNPDESNNEDANKSTEYSMPGKRLTTGEKLDQAHHNGVFLTRTTMDSETWADFVKQTVTAVDRFCLKKLKTVLKRAELSPEGDRIELRVRAHNYYHAEYAALNLGAGKTEKQLREAIQHFDFLVIIDVECTCIGNMQSFPHEIIELPSVLVDVQKMKVVSEFQTYVKPVNNPILSEFCKNLTKISQEKVDQAPEFPEAYTLYQQWMQSCGLFKENVRFAFVADGPHDLCRFMQRQFIQCGMRLPAMMRPFINIKKAFRKEIFGFGQIETSGIEYMLEKLDLPFEGCKHSGLDDAKNIARICIGMMNRGVELVINQKCCFKETITKNLPKKKEKVPKKEVCSARDFYLITKELPLGLKAVSIEEFMKKSYLNCGLCRKYDETDQNGNNQQNLIPAEQKGNNGNGEEIEGNSGAI